MAVTIDRVSLTVADAQAAAAFYGTALGFRPAGSRVTDGRIYGVAGARAEVTLLALGLQRLELVAFDRPGAPYPAAPSSHDPWFQHFAIVVSDMAAAWQMLARVPGWQPISTDGPQRLPATSGGVSAFKFRDPEGHPLELLHFPAHATPPAWRQASPGDRPMRGIDHSAIVVAQTAASIAFYRGLGLLARPTGINAGPAQEALDGVGGVQVEVTALETSVDAPPHLELLCYRQPSGPAPIRMRGNDIACTRLMLAGLQQCPPHDPDGHALLLAGVSEA